MGVVVDRAMVAFIMLGFVLTDPLSIQLVAPVAILNPVLAFITWWFWRQAHFG